VSALAPPATRAQLPLGGEGRGDVTPLRERLAGGGRPTLGQELERAWEGLLAAGVADCPMCSGEMRRDGEDGTCASCGTVIA
jgi:hypothetical protein